MTRRRTRTFGCAAAKLYAAALGISVVGGFFAGVWAPAFWLGTAPFILKIVSYAWAKEPGKN
jgi:hypothetical protein